MRGLGAAGWWEGAVHVESFPPVVCVAPGMRMQRAVGSTVHMHVCEWHGERRPGELLEASPCYGPAVCCLRPGNPLSELPSFFLAPVKGRPEDDVSSLPGSRLGPRE